MSNLDAFFKKKIPSKPVSNPPPLKPVTKIIPSAPKIDEQADNIEAVEQSNEPPPLEEGEDLDLEIEEEPEPAKKTLMNSPQRPNPKLPNKLPNKLVLICENKKCKYQRIFVKSKLDLKDKICPKCGGKMHQKKPAAPKTTFKTL